LSGGNERVEALGVLVEAVNENTPVLGLGIRARTVESGMRGGSDELPFASGRPLHRLLLLFRPASVEPEDPHRLRAFDTLTSGSRRRGHRGPTTFLPTRQCGPYAVPTTAIPVKKASVQGEIGWAHLGSNQGPLACEASALPLSYAPQMA
jgi:hypothetical protein